MPKIPGEELKDILIQIKRTFYEILAEIIYYLTETTIHVFIVKNIWFLK